tara:strand:+ start:358 stop:1560 length:1203 start_codon:yes stop_codon:yes gene_type:complete
MVQQTGLLGNFGQNMQRGFGRIGDAITGKDLNARDQLSLALMSLSGNPQQTQALQQLAANRIQQRRQNEANNKTVAFIKNINPEIGALVEANPALAPTALQQIMRARMSGGADNSTALMKNFAFLREQFPDMQPNDLLQMARGGTSVNITNQLGGEQAGGLPKTDAVKELDKKYTTELIKWQTNEQADSQKLIEQLSAVANELNTSGFNLSGPILNLIPDAAKAFTESGQRAISIRESVEEVVQRNLKAILGGQFTEREGEKLVKRAFNPALDESENLLRVNRLLAQLKTAYAAKTQMANHFSENGTLAGFDASKIPKIGDFFDVLDTLDSAENSAKISDSSEKVLNTETSKTIESPNTSSNMTASDIRGLSFDALLNVNVDNLDLDALQELNRRFTEGR